MTIILGSNLIVAGGGGDDHTKYTDTEAIAAVEGETTLDLAGDVDVATGKTLSADGLLFPDTQVASADANALDDYEEGTWTPILTDDDNNASESQTYTTQAGFYTKIGRLVYFTLLLTMLDLGNLNTAQGARIGGLPFTSANGTNQRHNSVAGTAANIAINATENIVGQIRPNEAFIRVQLWDTTIGTSNFLLSEWSDDGQVHLSGCYEV